MIKSNNQYKYPFGQGNFNRHFNNGYLYQYRQIKYSINSLNYVCKLKKLKMKRIIKMLEIQLNTISIKTVKQSEQNLKKKKTTRRDMPKNNSYTTKHMNF